MVCHMTCRLMAARAERKRTVWTSSGSACPRLPLPTRANAASPRLPLGCQLGARGPPAPTALTRAYLVCLVSGWANA